YCVDFSCVLFFFQAEDGIRDFHVTGVQTCALPICRPPRWPERIPPPRRLSRTRSRCRRSDPVRKVAGRRRRYRRCHPPRWPGRRSEERRVGKECRSGRRRKAATTIEKQQGEVEIL